MKTTNFSHGLVAVAVLTAAAPAWGDRPSRSNNHVEHRQPSTFAQTAAGLRLRHQPVVAQTAPEPVRANHARATLHETATARRSASAAAKARGREIETTAAERGRDAVTAHSRAIEARRMAEDARRDLFQATKELERTKQNNRFARTDLEYDLDRALKDKHDLEKREHALRSRLGDTLGVKDVWFREEELVERAELAANRARTEAREMRARADAKVERLMESEPRDAERPKDHSQSKFGTRIWNYVFGETETVKTSTNREPSESMMADVRTAEAKARRAETVAVTAKETLRDLRGVWATRKPADQAIARAREALAYEPPRLAGEVKQLEAWARKLTDKADSAEHAAREAEEAHRRAAEVAAAAAHAVDEWKVTERKRIAADVRGVIGDADAQTLGVDARASEWGLKVFRTHKATAEASDNRDAVSVNFDAGRVAIADGYTVGNSTGEWAKLLAHAYTGHLQQQSEEWTTLPRTPSGVDVASINHWLTPLQEGWSRLATAGSRFSRAASQVAGGGSTLLGMEFHPASDGTWAWKASGAGDSNLFVVRDNRVIKTWPMTSSSAFGFDAEFLSFIFEKNANVKWQETDGQLKPGDRVFLMTDALAAWTLRKMETGKNPFAELATLSDQTSFEAFVAKERGRNGKANLYDDDTTLVQFVVPSKATVARER